jgi:hypothetical protein
LDLAAEENALMFYGVKEGLGLSGRAAAATDAIREGVTTFVGMQKKFLDLINDQSQAAVEAIKEGKPYEGKNLSEVTREGLENFVKTQKKFLDLVMDVAEPAERKGGKEEPQRKVNILAKEGIEKFVEAQKKLLDLASKQIDEAVKTAQDVVESMPEPSTSLGEFARRGTENFINAQKSLLDVALKTFTPAPPHTPVVAHAGGRRRK